MTIDEIAAMMQWQAGCTRAMADNTPPPLPPIDLQTIMMEQMKNDQWEKPSFTAMTADGMCSLRGSSSWDNWIQTM